MQPLEFMESLWFPWFTDPVNFSIFLLIVMSVLLLIFSGVISSLRQYKKRSEAERDRICELLCHLEERYDESLPAVAIAARYVMFSKYAGDDEELSLLDDLLRNEAVDL